MACRGRNTVVNLTKGLAEQVLEGEDVVSFEWTGNQRVARHRFFGATTDVHEEVYENVRFVLVLNHRSPAVLNFTTDVLARGRREVNFSVKIVTEFVYPNGETSRLKFADCKFENPGMSVPGRDQNVATTLVGYCAIAEPLVLPV